MLLFPWTRRPVFGMLPLTLNIISAAKECNTGLEDRSGLQLQEQPDARFNPYSYSCTTHSHPMRTRPYKSMFTLCTQWRVNQKYRVHAAALLTQSCHSLLVSSAFAQVGKRLDIGKRDDTTALMKMIDVRMTHL